MVIKSLRRHQAKAEEIGAEIHAGARNEKIITACVTPGGGKTLMAAIYAHQLLKGDVLRVLVVCPRLTLQAQMRSGFRVPELGLNWGVVVGHASTRSLLRDDSAGCVTTYQDIVKHPERWLRFVKEVPTLLILDEAHHLQAQWWGPEDVEESGWTAAVAPLVELSHRVLLMTGTMSRDNGSPVAFVNYAEDRTPTIHIKYTRRDALDERAIINVSAKLCDGDAAYWHRFSQHRHTLSATSGKDESRALVALLSDAQYRNQVIKEALTDFAQHRQTRNPSARMIIICANQKQAKSVSAFLRDDGAYRVVLAISDEPRAHQYLARFRDRGEGDILVTCQMAYEGLDVPECTHLVALTNFRSRPWLEQALSRVTRFDPKCKVSWDDQCAFLYVPSDHDMVSFLSEWIDEQDPRFNDPPTPLPPPTERPRRSTFAVISGTMTDTRYADTYGVFTDADQHRIELIDVRCPYIRHLPAIQRLDLAKQMWPDDANLPNPAEVKETA